MDGWIHSWNSHGSMIGSFIPQPALQSSGRCSGSPLGPNLALVSPWSGGFPLPGHTTLAAIWLHTLPLAPSLLLRSPWAAPPVGSCGPRRWSPEDRNNNIGPGLVWFTDGRQGNRAAEIKVTSYHFVVLGRIFTDVFNRHLQERGQWYVCVWVLVCVCVCVCVGGGDHSNKTYWKQIFYSITTIHSSKTSFSNFLNFHKVFFKFICKPKLVFYYHGEDV